MLCQFQVYSKVIQLYIYIHLFFFKFFFHLGYYTVLSRVPCAIRQVLVGLDVGEGTTEVMYPSCPITLRTHDLLLGMLTLITQLRWCLPGFSAAKLLFLFFHALFTGIKSLSPVHIQERYIKLYLLGEGYQRICSPMLKSPQ